MGGGAISVIGVRGSIVGSGNSAGWAVEGDGIVVTSVVNGASRVLFRVSKECKEELELLELTLTISLLPASQVL